jgi:hypothetical protein
VREVFFCKIVRSIQYVRSRCYLCTCAFLNYVHSILCLHVQQAGQPVPPSGFPWRHGASAYTHRDQAALIKLLDYLSKNIERMKTGRKQYLFGYQIFYRFLLQINRIQNVLYKFIFLFLTLNL